MPRNPGRPTGRPPKPAEEKRRLGNPGQRELPDPATVTALPGVDLESIPEPSRLLGQIGRDLWNRIWKSGAVWLARNVDAETILILCEQMDERAALRRRVFEAGDWRDRTALRALDQQVMTGLALLGFNPVDRARLGTAEVLRTDPADAYFGRRTQGTR